MPFSSLNIPDARARLSLRLRLTLWIVLIFAIAYGSTLGVMWFYERATTYERFDMVLRNRARRLAAVMAGPRANFSRREFGSLVEKEFQGWPFINVVADLLDSQGVSVLFPTEQPIPWGRGEAIDSKAGIQDEFRLVAVEKVIRGQPAEAPWRTVGVRLPVRNGSGYFLVVAASDEAPQGHLATTLQVGLFSSLVGVFAAAVCGWFIAGMAVAPFERLREMVQRLTPQSLDQRLQVPNASPEVARLTAELNEARDRIRLGFVAQERFLSNVSHELKTPIAVLLIEAQTLNPRELSSRMQTFVKSVEDELTKLGRLVESFLTLTRIQDGKGLAEMRLVGANDLVMESTHNCAMMANQHGVELRPRLLDTEETIDAGVRGDPYLLMTMLDNLVRNAIRFSPERGRIDIILATSHRLITISVRDQGPGIPPDRLDTIFDRFAQVHSAVQAGRGHGLGLTIAQGIAELHRGCIFASNMADGGTEFTISLPMGLASEYDSSFIPLSPQSTSREGRLR